MKPQLTALSVCRLSPQEPPGSARPFFARLGPWPLWQTLRSCHEAEITPFAPVGALLAPFRPPGDAAGRSGYALDQRAAVVAGGAVGRVAWRETTCQPCGPFTSTLTTRRAAGPAFPRPPAGAAALWPGLRGRL